MTRWLISGPRPVAMVTLILGNFFWKLSRNTGSKDWVM